jgi:hypothetical protein
MPGLGDLAQELHETRFLIAEPMLLGPKCILSTTLGEGGVSLWGGVRGDNQLESCVCL